GGLVEVERRPFPRFTASKDGTGDLVPQSAVLRRALDKAKVSVSLERLEGLATGFLQANSARDVGPAMEAWRRRVLSEFDGDMRSITVAANVCRQVSSDKSMAYALLKVAAEEGHANAAYHYSVLLGTLQISIPNGRNVGAQIIKRLAGINHPPSQIVLADRHFALGNHQAGLELLHSAAQHSAVAAFKLGEVYRKASPADHEAAEHWYARAAERGLSDGYFMLGNMRSRGDTSGGVPDYEAAFHMFEWAAAGGNAESQYNVGVYYLEGKGVERNPRLAAEYWAMAAAQRFPVALLNLGKLVAEGTEVPRDLRRARTLLTIAADCSGPDGFIRDEATALLDRLDHVGKDTQCTIL
ncbi:hypothetical protein LPJ61_005036, partial [Coemansia biformis]